jgi:hypothetical protein
MICYSSPFRQFIVVMACVLALGAVVAGCTDDDGEADGTASSDDTEANVADDAPDPEPVNADDLDIIDEWEEAGVPRFRNGEVLDFEPHASRIENGGTLLLDGDEASAKEVIAFYRGALGELGWKERRVADGEMTAESDVASLLVTVNEYEEETLIMMILTDRLDDSS